MSTTIDIFLANIVIPYNSEVSSNLIVDRNNILNSIYSASQRDANFFNKKLNVIFEGEDGIDVGGLTRELFTQLKNDIQGYGTDYDKDFFITADTGSIYSTFNCDNNNLDKYKLIGKLFAYAIKTRQTIDIQLEPIILHMLLNSTYNSDEVNITDTLGSKLLNIIGQEDAEKVSKVDEMIAFENYYKSTRQTRGIDTWQQIKQIIDDYDCTIFSDPTNRLSKVYKLQNITNNEWTKNETQETIFLCFDEPGMICVNYDTFENIFQDKYEDRDFVIEFFIKSYLIERNRKQIEGFVRGFHDIIHPSQIPTGLTIKDLNKLIRGDTDINVEDFLSNTNMYIGAYQSTTPLNPIKRSYIDDYIRKQSSKDNEYLNDLFFVISSSRNLPSLGFNDPGIHKPRIYFSDVIFQHTCFNAIEFPESYITELPLSTNYKIINKIKDCNKIKNDIDKILDVFLSKDVLISTGKETFNTLGGSYLIPLRYEYN